jgi:hypothetical protein
VAIFEGNPKLASDLIARRRRERDQAAALPVLPRMPVNGYDSSRSFPWRGLDVTSAYVMHFDIVAFDGGPREWNARLAQHVELVIAKPTWSHSWRQTRHSLAATCLSRFVWCH